MNESQREEAAPAAPPGYEVRPETSRWGGDGFAIFDTVANRSVAGWFLYEGPARSTMVLLHLSHQVASAR